MGFKLIKTHKAWKIRDTTPFEWSFWLMSERSKVEKSMNSWKSAKGIKDSRHSVSWELNCITSLTFQQRKVYKELEKWEIV